MTRVAVTDHTGEPVGWFDPQKAIVFNESTWHDGSNFISKATGAQLEHEALYFTASHKWVLHQYSQRQGAPESFEILSLQDAAQWFLKNEVKDNDLAALPGNVATEVREILNQHEL